MTRSLMPLIIPTHALLGLIPSRTCAQAYSVAVRKLSITPSPLSIMGLLTIPVMVLIATGHCIQALNHGPQAERCTNALTDSDDGH